MDDLIAAAGTALGDVAGHSPQEVSSRPDLSRTCTPTRNSLASGDGGDVSPALYTDSSGPRFVFTTPSSPDLFNASPAAACRYSSGFGMGYRLALALTIRTPMA